MHRQEYDENIARYICEQVGNGRRLGSVLDEIGLSNSVWNRWLDEQPELSVAWVRAQQAQADMLMDSALETAENATPKTASADKVKVDTVMKVAERLHPAAWSPRHQVDHTVEPVQKLSDDQIREQLKNALTGDLGVLQEIARDDPQMAAELRRALPSSAEAQSGDDAEAQSDDGGGG